MIHRSQTKSWAVIHMPFCQQHQIQETTIHMGITLVTSRRNENCRVIFQRSKLFD